MARRPRSQSAPTAPPQALLPKKQPAQQRAIETYELILSTTAELLAEVGVERLSTNLVCQRAGLTPPAIYRYFPNKYALLHELGRRLMLAQNELIAKWLTPDALSEPGELLQQQLVGLFLDTYRVTAKTTGGAWITRALRAVPTLQEVRIASHNLVTEELQAGLQVLYPQVGPKVLRINIRLAVEVMYSALEMLFDDPKLSSKAVADSMAWMVVDLFVRLRETHAGELTAPPLA